MTEQEDHELLSQYIDGELGSPAATALEARLAAEPNLKAQLQRLQALNTEVQAAFDVPGADTVPARVSRLLQKPANNVFAFPERRRAAWGFAVAATVLAASGLLFVDGAGQINSPGMPESSPLAQILEHSPSRAEGWDQLGDGSQVRPILSFQSKSGQWCREFLLGVSEEHWRGVACRGGSGWTTRALGVEEGVSTADEYRPAGSGNAEEVSRFVDAEAGDIALSIEQEAQLIDNSWQ